MRQRANKVTGCPYCQHFHAIGVRCEVCKSAPQTASTGDKARKRPKTRQSQSTRQKPLSAKETCKRLRDAQLTSVQSIRDGLADGRVMNALFTGKALSEGVFLRYVQLVRIVGNASKYQYRLVSGVAA